MRTSACEFGGDGDTIQITRMNAIDRMMYFTGNRFILKWRNLRIIDITLK